MLPKSQKLVLSPPPTFNYSRIKKYLSKVLFFTRSFLSSPNFAPWPLSACRGYRHCWKTFLSHPEPFCTTLERIRSPQPLKKPRKSTWCRFQDCLVQNQFCTMVQNQFCTMPYSIVFGTPDVFLPPNSIYLGRKWSKIVDFPGIFDQFWCKIWA